MKTSKKIYSLCLFLAIVATTSCSKDDGCATKLFYFDGDGDGFGLTSNSKAACSAPSGFVEKSGDTDDTDGLIYPGCSEKTFYFDKDGDDYGDPNATEIGCIEKPDGYVTNGDDCDDTDATINPNAKIIYYEDLDGDGFGNEDKSVQLSVCDAVPENHTTNDSAFDCDDTNKSVNPDSAFTYYLDADGDGYGTAATTFEDLGCKTDIVDFVDNKDDCNDLLANVNPGADEKPGDGLDNNCDGISGFVWDGPDMVFSKTSKADWTNTKNQDQLTENVIFTRQDDGPMYNFAWWEETFKTDAVHTDDTSSDLIADFNNDMNAAIKDFNAIAATGGTKNVRWALLDNTGGNGGEAWDNFEEFYGTLGDPTHFYSFHNLLTIIGELEGGNSVLSVVDDFFVDIDGFGNLDRIADLTEDLIGKKLGVWLVDDDIYLTLTFTEWEEGNGGAFSYIRSTPNN